ncbi:MAG: hypothetical protein ACREET_00575 [Stellaceae bacterium]
MRSDAALPRAVFVALALIGTSPTVPARADEAGAARAGEVAHLQKMRQLFPDAAAGVQPAPAIIPQLRVDPDPGGAIATFQPSGPTVTAKNAFFSNLGSNGRTCFTCHQPQDGWALRAQHVRSRFAADPNDPLFRLVDGATCPSDNVATPAQRRKAFALLLGKGLIRIGLPLPAQGLQFRVVDVADPYDCNTNPTTGLTSHTTGTVSVYRRPLPAANLGFLSTIMWDGREPDLFSQARDATLGHAQATVVPTTSQQRQIVRFEGCTRADTPPLCATIPRAAGVYTAQLFDDRAFFLDEAGAAGGPGALFDKVAKFFIGVNDPFGSNPTNATFTPDVFHLYDKWRGLPGNGAVADARRAIARGEEVFDTKKIAIAGVAGINDALGKKSVAGFCATCHDTPATGDHSVKAPLDIGVAAAGKKAPPVLDIAGLPVFRLQCTAGPLAGRIFEVTDPGRALITGQCADVGKVKGPILRGLPARAPYFHNGSAASLADVVDFYDKRFAIGFTKEEKTDLVAFLSSL